MTWQKKLVITLTMSISAVAVVLLWLKRQKNNIRSPEVMPSITAEDEVEQEGDMIQDGGEEELAGTDNEKEEDEKEEKEDEQDGANVALEQQDLVKEEVSSVEDVEGAAVDLEDARRSGRERGMMEDERKSSFDEETLSDDSSVSSTALQNYTLSENSLLATMPDNDGEERQTLEIEFPQALCGRLIGRKGKNVKIICERSGAKIHLIPQSPGDMSTQRIISISGIQPQIQSALESIHQKFPSIPLTPLNQPRTGSFSSKSCNIFAQLPDSPTFDVVVTHVVSAGQFFVNIHSDQNSLLISQLSNSMMECYSPNSYIFMPPLAQPVTVGTFCALPTYEGWCRAQVVGVTGNPEEVDVKYLDYGNIGRVSLSILRQLRADFLSFPFQAIECYLANVIPKEGESTFSLASNAIFEELVYNVVLSAHFTCYKNGHPCLELYRPQGIQNLFINRELVNRALCRWSET